MNPAVKNVLAVIIGIMVGWIVNMFIVMMSGQIVPMPEGVNPNDLESLKASAHLFKPIHYLMPFLAHALGTLVGAFMAAKVAAKNPARIGLIVGVFFLLGGILAATMIPAPIWFIIADLVLAYIPMSMLGARLAGNRTVAQ